MTPFEKLVALSSEFQDECAKKGGNPRRPLDELGWAMADLPGEIPALWRAIQTEADWIGTAPHPDILDALEALNAKADEVMK